MQKNTKVKVLSADNKLRYRTFYEFDQDLVSIKPIDIKLI
jgi:histidyl-tRNA synthetase